MRVRHGSGPVLYHLEHEGRDIGTVTRRDGAGLVLTLHGFTISSAAVSAAWLAYRGRIAYEMQAAERAAGSGEGTGRSTPTIALPSLGSVHDLVAYDEGGTTRLCVGDVEIARMRDDGSAQDGSQLWTVEVPLGPADMPAVFALAAARRMWDGVRRAGLWRHMVQWSAPPTPAA